MVCVVAASGCIYRVKQWAFVIKLMWLVVNFVLMRVWMIEMSCMFSWLVSMFTSVIVLKFWVLYGLMGGGECREKVVGEVQGCYSVCVVRLGLLQVQREEITGRVHPCGGV